jgi:release factor glutamine methyltransferase
VKDSIARLREAGCVFAEEEAELIAARFPAAADREAAVVSRCAGTPLELVLGTATFAGVTLTVESGVFLPRMRAEVLVELADRFGASDSGGSGRLERPVTALDLGCGTGAIAAALRARHPEWSVHASDLAPAAVRCALANAARFGFTVHRSDWFDGLPLELLGGFDLVVAHLPYVPTSHLDFLPRDYRAAEPRSAIDGGADGLDPWRAVAGTCGRWLAPGGHVLTQVTAEQQRKAVAVAERQGLRPEVFSYADSVVIVAGRPDA